MNVSYSFGKCLWTTAINKKCIIAFKMVGHGAYSDNYFLFSLSLLPYTPYALPHFHLGVGLFLKTGAFRRH